MSKINIETKECNVCGIVKPLTEFYKQNQKRKNGIVIYYNPECKECTKKRSRQWAIENPDTVKKSNIKMYYKRRDEFNKWRRENKDRWNETLVNWQRNNPDKIKEYNTYRDAHKKHNISGNEWEECKKYFNHRCAYCGLVIEEHYIKYRGKIQLGDFSKEHVIDDGNNDLSNCVPACKSCNSAKREYTLEEWYNESNPIYTYERLEKINQWLNEDYKKYIKDHKK